MGIFNFSKNVTKEEIEVKQEATEPTTNHTHHDGNGADEVFSVPVKAGKRIYYFDVKSTRADDYYITITESRKKQLRDGSFTIDKHKIHLYKEDFAKFAEGFEQVIEFVKQHKPEFFNTEEETEDKEVF